MSGAATAPGQDPSMEDILASIRKILNEEEAAAPAPVPSEPRGPVLPPEEPLELTEEMLVAPPPSAPVPARPALLEPEPQAALNPPAPTPPAPTPPAPAAAAVEPVATPPVLEALVPQPAVEAALPPRQPVPAGAPDLGEGLVAPATAAAAAAILGQLARTVAAERSAPVHRGGPSIEDVVREELRPMLKDWMDAHLPALMERLVRAEIERVVSRSLG